MKNMTPLPFLLSVLHFSQLAVFVLISDLQRYKVFKGLSLSTSEIFRHIAYFAYFGGFYAN
jgi:hypothetical protein